MSRRFKKTHEETFGKTIVGLVNDGMKVFAMSGPEDKEKAGSLDMRVLKSKCHVLSIRSGSFEARSLQLWAMQVSTCTTS